MTSIAEKAQVIGAPAKVETTTVDKLVQLNDLSYTLPTSLSVMVNTRYAKYPFNRQSYAANEQAQCTIQSGDLWMSPQDTYLTFSVKGHFTKVGNTAAVPGAGGEGTGASSAGAHHLLTWGIGSAANILDSIIIEDEAGTEIVNERNLSMKIYQQDINTLGNDLITNPMAALQGYARNRKENRLTDNSEWADNGVGTSIRNTQWGSLPYVNLNYNTNVADGAVDQANDNPAGSGAQNWVKFTFMIPMAKICGFFNQSKLLPSYVTSGLRIKLNFQRSFWDVFDVVPLDQPFLPLPNNAPNPAAKLACVATPGTYEVEDLHILSKVYMLTDSIQARLNEVAAKQGLILMFESVFSESYTPAGTTANIQIKKGVSRANKAVVVSQLPANFQGLTGTPLMILETDPTAVISSYQWRLGSTYYPAHVADSAEERYLYNREFFSSSNNTKALTLYTFKEAQKYANLVTCVLERSKILALSGLPIQASHLLVCDIRFTAAAARQLTSFLHYTTVLNVFNDRSILNS